MSGRKQKKLRKLAYGKNGSHLDREWEILGGEQRVDGDGVRRVKRGTGKLICIGKRKLHKAFKSMYRRGDDVGIGVKK